MELTKVSKMSTQYEKMLDLPKVSKTKQKTTIRLHKRNICLLFIIYGLT